LIPSEEQRITLDAFRRFVEAEIAPAMQPWRDATIPKDLAHELLRKLAPYGVGSGLQLLRRFTPNSGRLCRPLSEANDLRVARPSATRSALQTPLQNCSRSQFRLADGFCSRLQPIPEDTTSFADRSVRRETCVSRAYACRRVEDMERLIAAFTRAGSSCEPADHPPLYPRGSAFS
jgi:hypothetical protein